MEAEFRFKMKVTFKFRSRLEVSFFPCGKQDYNPSMLFLVFILFLKVFIVLLLKSIVMLLVANFHFLVASR